MAVDESLFEVIEEAKAAQRRADLEVLRGLREQLRGLREDHEDPERPTHPERKAGWTAALDNAIWSTDAAIAAISGEEN